MILQLLKLPHGFTCLNHLIMLKYFSLLLRPGLQTSLHCNHCHPMQFTAASLNMSDKRAYCNKMSNNKDDQMSENRRHCDDNNGQGDKMSDNKGNGETMSDKRSDHFGKGDKMSDNNRKCENTDVITPPAELQLLRDLDEQRDAFELLKLEKRIENDVEESRVHRYVALLCQRVMESYYTYLSTVSEHKSWLDEEYNSAFIMMKMEGVKSELLAPLVESPEFAALIRLVDKHQHRMSVDMKAQTLRSLVFLDADVYDPFLQELYFNVRRDISACSISGVGDLLSCVNMFGRDIRTLLRAHTRLAQLIESISQQDVPKCAEAVEWLKQEITPDFATMLVTRLNNLVSVEDMVKNRNLFIAMTKVGSILRWATEARDFNTRLWQSDVKGKDKFVDKITQASYSVDLAHVQSLKYIGLCRWGYFGKTNTDFKEKVRRSCVKLIMQGQVHLKDIANFVPAFHDSYPYIGDSILEVVKCIEECMKNGEKFSMMGLHNSAPLFISFYSMFSPEIQHAYWLNIMEKIPKLPPSLMVYYIARPCVKRYVELPTSVKQGINNAASADVIRSNIYPHRFKPSMLLLIATSQRPIPESTMEQIRAVTPNLNLQDIAQYGQSCLCVIKSPSVDKRKTDDRKELLLQIRELLDNFNQQLLKILDNNADGDDQFFAKALETFVLECPPEYMSDTVVRKLIVPIVQNIDYIKPRSKQNIFKAFTKFYKLKYFNAKLYDEICAAMATRNTIDNYSFSLESQFIKCCSNVDYVPKDFIPFLVNANKKYSYHNMLIKKEWKGLIHLLTDLSVLQIFPEDILMTLFTVENMRSIDRHLKEIGNLAPGVHERLFQLNRSVALQCPQLNIPWLFHNSIHFQERAHWRGFMQEQVEACLTKILFGEKFFMSKFTTPYLHQFSFMFLLDKHGNPVPVENYSKLQNARDVHRFALLLQGKGVYCYDTNRLNGRASKFRRELQILGYDVIQINMDSWNSCKTLKAKTQYLRETIKLASSSVSKSSDNFLKV